MRRILEEAHTDIIKAFDKELLPFSEIADRYGVSRQGIWRLLQKHRVDTSKRLYPVKCNWCEKEIFRTKKVIRRARQHFCDSDNCWDSYMKEIGKDYLPGRHGERMGRAVVSQYFELQEANIVHNEDNNRLNNALWNIKVFAHQKDHIRYHRGVIKVVLLWDGAKEHLHI